jgi:DNA uptake protein ComE-like DNA-binding protein
MRKLSYLLSAAVICLAFAVTGIAAEKKAPAAKPEAAKASPEKAAEAKPAAKDELLDINTATEDQLKAIAGIGDTYASKIIAGRPYTKKDQLVSKNIVPKNVYDKIKDRIIAKKVKK